MFVVQRYAEHGSGQYCLNRSFQLNGLFITHINQLPDALPSRGLPIFEIQELTIEDSHAWDGQLNQCAR